MMKTLAANACVRTGTAGTPALHKRDYFFKHGSDRLPRFVHLNGASADFLKIGSMRQEMLHFSEVWRFSYSITLFACTCKHWGKLDK